MQQFIDTIIEFSRQYVGDFWISIISFIPVVELRGAIPLAANQGVNPFLALVLAVFGNMLPVIPIVLVGRKFLNWLKTKGPFKKFAMWFEARTLKNKDKVIKYSMLGLGILVAVPLPGTGAWTGAFLAALLDIRLKYALPTILAGVIVAGLIMTLVSYGIAAI